MKQQRLVNQTLKEEIQGIHGLQVCCRVSFVKAGILRNGCSSKPWHPSSLLMTSTLYGVISLLHIPLLTAAAHKLYDLEQHLARLLRGVVCDDTGIIYITASIQYSSAAIPI